MHNQQQTMTLNKTVLARRADAKVATAGALATLFALFATIPMSIRQRDWRVAVVPFMAAWVIAFIGTTEENKSAAAIYKLAGWGAQGGLAALLIARNKEDAREQLGLEAGN